MADLKAYLTSLAREPFAYGRCDCALVLGRWWASNRGIDPTAVFAGTYGSKEECDALLAAHGGLLRMARSMAASVNAQRARTFKPGDLGVVRFQGQHFGAIHTPSGKWAIKGGDGIIVTSTCKPLMVWSI